MDAQLDAGGVLFGYLEVNIIYVSEELIRMHCSGFLFFIAALDFSSLCGRKHDVGNGF